MATEMSTYWVPTKFWALGPEPSHDMLTQKGLPVSSALVPRALPVLCCCWSALLLALSTLRLEACQVSFHSEHIVGWKDTPVGFRLFQVTEFAVFCLQWSQETNLTFCHTPPEWKHHEDLDEYLAWYVDHKRHSNKACWINEWYMNDVFICAFHTRQREPRGQDLVATHLSTAILVFHTAVNSTQWTEGISTASVKPHDLERVDKVVVKYVSFIHSLLKENQTIWSMSGEWGGSVFLYLTGSSQHATKSKRVQLWMKTCKFLFSFYFRAVSVIKGSSTCSWSETPMHGTPRA